MVVCNLTMEQYCGIFEINIYLRLQIVRKKIQVVATIVFFICSENIFTDVDL